MGERVGEAEGDGDSDPEAEADGVADADSEAEQGHGGGEREEMPSGHVVLGKQLPSPMSKPICLAVASEEGRHTRGRLRCRWGWGCGTSQAHGEAAMLSTALQE